MSHTASLRAVPGEKHIFKVIHVGKASVGMYQSCQLTAAWGGDAQNLPEGLGDAGDGEVWVVGVLVSALYSTGRKSWVPPPTTAATLTLFLNLLCIWPTSAAAMG